MKVLFLCTGNSCRSQMAEGFARSAGLEATSAGIEAHGLNPRAVTAMREAGIDIRQQESKTLSPELVRSADMIVTVCDTARESCPIVPSSVRQLHWSFADPAAFVGTEQEIVHHFRQIRDQIRDKVHALVEELTGSR